MEIPLSRGRVALTDPKDWPLVSQHTWHAKLENGGRWYAATTFRDPATKQKRTLKMHDLIKGIRPGEMADRRGTAATLDNWGSNLSVCSNAQNQKNTGSRGGSSRFKGVSWSAKKRRWLVQFRCHGAYHFVGYFVDEVAAARTHDSAIQLLAGEFARLDFPQAA